MKRRDLIRQTTAALAVGATAGCLSESDDAASEDDGDGESTTEETTTEESTTTATGSDDAAVRATSMSASEAECQSADGEESAEVTFGDGQVVVSGAVSLPDPCHTPALAAAEYDGDGELLVAVDAGQTGSEACVQCTGIAEYEATVSLNGEGPTAVRVEHRTMGERRTITDTSQ
jgi:hypothetical protein